MKSSQSSVYLGTLAVLFFCVPLFVGLGEGDFTNDEAIYSYAVDGILETGDWLTPRSIPHDRPFLEKPPLKFWIVAGAIRAGWLPHDEFGQRFCDALFGAVAFVYVFFIGRQLAGSMCGLVAVFVLVTLGPLLFVHGLRSNNMEAALFLSYCGGMYHFARWVEADSRRRQSMHALAVGVYFALGFMTKFVAALFLPLVCVMAFAWRDDAMSRIRSHWRDWAVSALLVLAATTPWFVYQALHAGNDLWRTMFGEHVYRRFTAGLDPRHLQPWHHYYSQTWWELTVAGSQWISMLGAVWLAAHAWTGRSWLTRLLFAWWVVPIALMSFGTSKLFHYAYPFLPPLALGAGAAAVSLFRAIEPRIALGAIALLRAAGASLEPKPTGWIRLLTPLPVVIALAVILPVWSYPLDMERLTSRGSPLRTLRDCILTAHQPRPGTNVYPAYTELLDHSYYYYLREAGPWNEHDGHPKNDELQSRLFTPDQQTLMLLLRTDYERFAQETGMEGPGLALSDNLVLLTPGSFEACGAAAVAAGGRGLGHNPAVSAGK